jgi:hypothetical protein
VQNESTTTAPTGIGFGLMAPGSDGRFAARFSLRNMTSDLRLFAAGSNGLLPIPDDLSVLSPDHRLLVPANDDLFHGLAGPYWVASKLRLITATSCLLTKTISPLQITSIIRSTPPLIQSTGMKKWRV